MPFRWHNRFIACITILHTNDFHGTLDSQRATQIRVEKSERNAYYFDSGDCVKSGNLSIPRNPEECWNLLSTAGCDASVPGNRESHPLRAGFEAKIRSVAHPIVCANILAKSGPSPFLASKSFQRNGLEIVVFGVMVPIVTDRMISRVVSDFIWTKPDVVAKEQVAKLRESADVLIALTHIGYAQDIRLAELCPELDIILGGHSHTVLEEPVQVGTTFICQGGSHGKWLGIYEWNSKTKVLSGKLAPFQ